MVIFLTIIGIPVIIFLLGLLLSVFQDLTYVASLMSGIATNLPFMLDFLPVGVGSVVSTACAIAVIAKILGRDG